MKMLCFARLMGKEGYKMSREKKEKIISVSFSILTALLITIAGIIFKQEVIRILPLYVSVIIGFLSAKASRYACLLGGINSIVYAFVYFSFGLYAMAIYSFLACSTLQFVTFIRWNKRAYKHSTEFKTLTKKQIFGVAVLFIISFIVLYVVMTMAGSSYRIIDNSVTLVGIFQLILMVLSFKEFTWLALVTGVLSIILDGRMSFDYPAQITYLIFSSYSFVCIVRQHIAVKKLYKEQNDK
jgi:nicotinamide mononucleotide transporter